MTKLIIANDNHLFSKYQDDPMAKEKLLALNPHKNTYLIGDNVDLACCKKKDLEEARIFERALFITHGKNYDVGNHERTWIDYKYMIAKTDSGKRALIVHGDLEGNKEKWTEYRKKSQGAGFFKNIQTAIFDQMDWLKDKRPLPSGFLQRAAELAETHHCDYYICGHFHPSSQRRYTKLGRYGGVTVIILPMGINEVILE